MSPQPAPQNKEGSDAAAVRALNRLLGPLGRGAFWIFGVASRAVTLIMFETRTESVFSLREVPKDWSICLNDVIEHCDAGWFPKDPKPKGLYWLGPQDFSFKHHDGPRIAGYGEFTFNRKITYAPENPNEVSTAFVSMTRKVQYGDLRMRRPRAMRWLAPLVRAAVNLSRLSN
jgi:hypothetical protein